MGEKTWVKKNMGENFVKSMGEIKMGGKET